MRLNVVRTHSFGDGKCTSWHSDQTFAAAKSPSTCVCVGRGLFMRKILADIYSVEYGVVLQEVTSINMWSKFVC